MKTGKRYILYPVILTVVVMLFATSCKKRCYYCVLRNDQDVITDTINSLCNDEQQYSGAVLSNWRVLCETANGEEVSSTE